MRLLIAVLALVVFASMGCTTTTPLRGDVTFTAQERSAIELGNAWMADRVHQEAFTIVWDLPHPLPGDAIPEHSIARVPPRVAVDYTTEGYSSATEARLEFDPETPDPRHNGDVLATLAAHQFGHVWGLDHHAGPGVMSGEVLEPGLAWSAEDQARCDVDRVCNR